MLFEHLRLSVEIKGERKGVIEFRKHYSGYLKGYPNASKVRQELMQFVEATPVIDRLQRYAESMEESVESAVSGF